MSKGKLVVISGASGVGKGTVLGIMMNKREDLKFSVSATTLTLSLSHGVQKTVLYISVSFAVLYTGLLLPSF